MNIIYIYMYIMNIMHAEQYNCNASSDIIHSCCVLLILYVLTCPCYIHVHVYLMLILRPVVSAVLI